MADHSGKNLGKYQLTDRLGRGGMAEVYKAYHPRLDRYVAIKILHGFLAGGDDFLERFEREARAAASLRHPNIVLVHDFDSQDEIYYMVMEYVEGITLKDRIEQLAARGEYMPIGQVVSLFRQVSSALDYAHSQGLIHRDIKPSNILLDGNGQAFLTDFGIAHIVSDSQFTVTGTLVGTPAYMSPEQGKGEKITANSDIYSLGVILYQLLTGRVPFDADTPLAVIHKHVNEPLPLPRLLNPSLSEDMERTILRALAKEASNRYERAEDLLHALESASRVGSTNDPDQNTIETRPTIVFSSDEQEQGKAKVKDGETAAGEFRTAPVEPEMAAPIDKDEEEFLAATEVMDQNGISSISEKLQDASMPVSENPADVTPDPTALRLVPEKAPPVSLVKNEEPSAGRKPWLVPLLGAAGLIVLIIVLVLSGVFGGGSVICGSPEECLDLARRSADGREAVEYIDRALSMVDRSPEFAFLLCERGEFLERIGEIPEAVDSYRGCLDWSMDDPALEEMRIFAQEQINRLNQ